MTLNTSKPWLKNYPEGVPHEIGPLSHSSLTQFLDECFARFGKRKAIEAMGRFFSYKEVDRLSKDFASYLQRVNSPEWGNAAIANLFKEHTYLRKDAKSIQCIAPLADKWGAELGTEL
jgi:long-chain acyl-CoA synthetase